MSGNPSILCLWNFAILTQQQAGHDPEQQLSLTNFVKTNHQHPPLKQCGLETAQIAVENTQNALTLFHQNNAHFSMVHLTNILFSRSKSDFIFHSFDSRVFNLCFVSCIHAFSPCAITTVSMKHMCVFRGE